MRVSRLIAFKLIALACAVVAILVVDHDAMAARLLELRLPNLFPFPNPTGDARTFSTEGVIRFDTHPFGQSLGTNGRACVHCHVPSDGWSIVPQHLRERFELTAGLDPVFRPNDGSNSPLADVSTYDARLVAYSLLLNKGLIRIGMAIPATAEFVLAEVDDPYGYASAAELSLFRRPLSSANVRFAPTLMWDGREPDLGSQANNATLRHAEATRPLTIQEQEAIADLQTSLSLAQAHDVNAGALDAGGASGGPRALADQDSAPTGSLVVFNLYDVWTAARGGHSAARQSVARGQALFHIKTCAACHSSLNIGANNDGLFINLGLSDESRRTPDLPLYTLQCVAGPRSGDTFRTTDPGRALITGRCGDIGFFKIPGLRGLAARAPYFHNGSAATLGDVVDFYDEIFRLNLTPQERADLVAFLLAL